METVYYIKCAKCDQYLAVKGDYIDNDGDRIIVVEHDDPCEDE